MTEKCVNESCDEESVMGKSECIFHLEQKDPDQTWIFISKLRERLETSQAAGVELNCAGFIFPAIAKGFFSNYLGAVKGANFKDAVFTDDISFSSSVFSEAAHFERAVFKGNAWFTGTKFEGGARFELAQFKKSVKFDGAAFGADAGFSGASFMGPARFGRWKGKGSGAPCSFKGAVKFDRAIFNQQLEIVCPVMDKGLSFRKVKLLRPGKVFLYHCNLKEARFLGTDLAGINFVGAEWPMKTILGFERRTIVSLARLIKRIWYYLGLARFTKWSRSRLRYQVETMPEKIPFTERNCLRDELDVYEHGNRKRKPKETAQNRLHEVRTLYAQLKKNYQDKREFYMASDWHIGEMEMRRWTMNRRRRRFSLHNYYRLLSGYGEKYTRAFLVLFILWLTVTSLNLCLGFKVPNYTPVKATAIKQQSNATRTRAPRSPQQEFTVVNYDLLFARGPDATSVSGWTDFLDSTSYTVRLFTLQRLIDVQPLNAWGRLMAVFAGIVGPLQIGLVVLSVKRYFRR